MRPGSALGLMPGAAPPIRSFGQKRFLAFCSPTTDVQFSSVKEDPSPSCSRPGTVVGPGCERGNDLVGHYRDISRGGTCRDVCVLVFVRQEAQPSGAANGSSDSDKSWAGALWSR